MKNINVPTAIIIQRSIPSRNDFAPAFLRSSNENPLPIRKRATTMPRRPRKDNSLYIGAPCGMKPAMSIAMMK